MLYYATGVHQRLPIGTNNQVLTVNTGLPAWTTLAPIIPININNPTNTQSLVYSTVDAAWVNATLSTANISNIVLSTPSNGNLITYSNGNLINSQSLPLTTNGDLFYYNSANSRLPIGSNGQFLSISTGLPAWSNFTSLGAGNSLISSNAFKSLVASGSVSISNNSNEITISSTGEANTYSSLGGTYSLITTKSGVNLPFKGISAGTNITISDSGSALTINASGGGGGYNAASNPVLIGLSASGSSNEACIIGHTASLPASCDGTTCIGSHATCTTASLFATIVGSYAKGNETRGGNFATAFGYQAVADGEAAVALGYGTRANRLCCALGTGSKALSSDNNNANWMTSIGVNCGRNLNASAPNKYCLFMGNNIVNGSTITSTLTNLCYIGNNIHQTENGATTQSIAINATTTDMNSINSNSFYVNPVRANAGTYAVKYNPTTYEITYDTGASSRLLKRNVKTLLSDGLLQDFKRMRVVSYQYLDDEATKIGVIAEELMLLPNLKNSVHVVDRVIMNDITYENVPGVRYDELYMKSMIAIQHLIGIVENQQSTINMLVSKINKIEEKLN